MRHLRSALLIGALAAVCGQATAAGISLPLPIDLPDTQLAVPSDMTFEVGLMSSLEFPETPESVFVNSVADDLAAVAPLAMAAQGRKGVPEPPTGAISAIGLAFAAVALVYRRKILRYGKHRLRG